MSVTMKSLEALLDKKFKEFEARVLTPVKEIIDGMEASLNFMSKQQDDMAKSLKDLQDKNKFLETENSLLRGQLAAVQNDINQQKDALNEYEQYSRRECLEFCGIGKRPIEDTNKIILTIGDALGVQINEERISNLNHFAIRNTHVYNLLLTVFCPFFGFRYIDNFNSSVIVFNRLLLLM